MDVVDQHRRAVDGWTARVAAVGDGQWELPTPCEDWNVRELVNHVVGEGLWMAPLLEGKTIADVGDQFDGDVVGSDPAATASRVAAQALEAAQAHVPHGGRVNLSYGAEDMHEYVRQLVADYLIHSWDLAKATGGDTGLDPDVVSEVAAWFAEREELYRGGGAIGPRGEGGGDAQSDLLVAFGRTP
jgi:uncharacterized protein (TIGR03086 family)